MNDLDKSIEQERSQSYSLSDKDLFVLNTMTLLTQAQQGKRFRRTVLASLGFVLLSLFSLPVVTAVERIFEAFSQKGIDFWIPLLGCSYVLMIPTLLLLRNNSSAFSRF